MNYIIYKDTNNLELRKSTSVFAEQYFVTYASQRPLGFVIYSHTSEQDKKNSSGVSAKCSYGTDTFRNLLCRDYLFTENNM
jgi:hypothetical protein